MVDSVGDLARSGLETRRDESDVSCELIKKNILDY
jgi:hypothetical protein